MGSFSEDAAEKFSFGLFTAQTQTHRSQFWVGTTVEQLEILEAVMSELVLQ